MVATNFRYPFASIPIAILIFVCAYFVDVVIKKIPLIGKWIVYIKKKRERDENNITYHGSRYR